MSSHRLFLYVVLLASFASLGCNYSGVVAPPAPEHPTIDGGASGSETASGGDASVTPDDFAPDGGGNATMVAPPQQGSPLCNASLATGCYPDTPTPILACPLDAGILQAAANLPDASLACRVIAGNGVPGNPVCELPGDAPAGTVCARSNECAAGLDCVVRGNLATCARYCCMGNSVCPSGEFCDVEPLVDPMTTQVPVCVPIKQCDLLLSPGACQANETCSVVREDGSVSCVEVGNATAGESCDVEHCAADLACIGVPGSRQCFKLCHTAGSDCPATQVCKGGMPLFSAAFGICVSQ